jgi:cytochrome oxidase Cu insertion factor (SCO1/SenC/PrrC family)
MRRALFVRLALMLGLAAMLVARMSCLHGAGYRSFARGAVGASSGEDGGDEQRAAGTAPAATGAPLTALSGRLTDAAGRARTLAEFQGQPFVTSLVYTRCVSVCPRVVAELQRFERDVAGTVPARFVLISLDPAHDTPEALRAFAALHALDSTRWTLLTPEPALLPPLASALGVAWRAGPDGGVAHSAVIAMVDRAGRVQDRRVGLSSAPEKLVDAWRAVQ